MARRARGLTLSEMLVTLAVVSVIALAVAGVAVALSAADAAADTYRESIRTAHAALARISRLVRSSILIPSADSQRLVLWTGDDNGNGAINLGELAVLSWDEGEEKLLVREIVFDESWQYWYCNPTFSLSQLVSASAVEQMLSGSQYCQTSLLASDVTGFELQVSPAPPLSTTVTVKLTVGQTSGTITVNSGATLRAPRVSNVLITMDGECYLENGSH